MSATEVASAIEGLLGSPVWLHKSVGARVELHHEVDKDVVRVFTTGDVLVAEFNASIIPSDIVNCYGRWAPHPTPTSE